MKKLALLLVAAATAACAAHTGAGTRHRVKGAKPAWADGDTSEYPKEGYLTGVGTADERASAEDRARSEISKIFTVTVTATTSDVMSETTSASGKGKDQSSFSQAVSQDVQTVSNKVLEDVTIAETWQDPATRRFYALAILQRDKAAMALKEKLSDLDKQALVWQKQLDGASDRLGRVKAAMKLMTLLKARDGLNADLRVVSASGSGESAPFDAAGLAPKAAKALAELDVAVDMGAGSDEVATGVIQALNGLGLQARAGSAGADADVSVEGSVQSAPEAGDGSAWKWARCAATVSVKDARAGKIFLRFDASERQASADYAKAERRSREAMAKKVAAKIREGVAAYFENQ